MPIGTANTTAVIHVLLFIRIYFYMHSVLYIIWSKNAKQSYYYGMVGQGQM